LSVGGYKPPTTSSLISIALAVYKGIAIGGLQPPMINNFKFVT
jgi:hypothetical protein